MSVLRKNSFCKCGCKGACTLHPVLKMFHWSLSSLASGHFPSQHYDGNHWSVSDGWRNTHAGSSLGIKAAVVHIKGDWMEFAMSLGLPTWSSNVGPCPFCLQNKSELFIASPFDPLTSPWTPAGHTEYDDACRRCERHVVMSRNDHATIIALLHYDKRKYGAKGRALSAPYPPLNLEKGDRLCPGKDVSDIGTEFDAAFADPTRTHLQATFWRRGNESRARWRNPLFDSSIGVTVEIVAIDILHTLYLGIAKDFCMRVMWCLIKNCVYGYRGRPQDERDQLSVLAMRHELWNWYQFEARAHPERHLHRLEDLVVTMLGKEHAPKLSTKAAETKTLVDYCRSQLRRWFHSIADEQKNCYMNCADGLVHMISIFDTSPRNLPAAAVQGLYDSMKKVFASWAGARWHMTPKMHLMLHAVERARLHGNPRFYSTFLDEGLNRVLRDIARSTHRLTWEVRIFERFAWAEQARAKRKRIDDVGIRQSS